MGCLDEKIEQWTKSFSKVWNAYGGMSFRISNNTVCKFWVLNNNNVS